MMLHCSILWYLLQSCWSCLLFIAIISLPITQTLPFTSMPHSYNSSAAVFMQSMPVEADTLNQSASLV
jgi:hypothetical protein